LLDKLWFVAQKTADHAKAADVAGTVITLKLKTSKFQTLTRRRTLPQPTQLADVIFKTCEQMLVKEISKDSRTAYRLIGAGLAGLCAPTGDSGDLLDPHAITRAKLERASDKARDKFGKKAVMKGREMKMRSRGMRGKPASSTNKDGDGPRSPKGTKYTGLKSLGMKGHGSDKTQWKSAGMKNPSVTGTPKPPK
jgi:DNA polymerase-4